MLVTEIIIHNFGVYKNRHTINIQPPSKEKNVILFGGLNGAGKTTLLDAIQLSLYGKLARCSNRGTLSYEEFLKRSINKTVNKKEGAAIGIKFRHFSNGYEQEYFVYRSWSSNGNGIKERVDVVRNGAIDHMLTDSWNEKVEEFIPNNISNLFFFDGDRIEEMANLDNSSVVLSSAINSLLGLDLIDRLKTDLKVFEKKKKLKTKSDTELNAIEEQRENINQIKNIKEVIFKKRASLNNKIDQCNKELSVIENEFMLEGGELFKIRKDMEIEKSEKENVINHIENELRELAGGVTPLLLVTEFLKEISSQIDKEEKYKKAHALASLLDHRDQKIIDFLKKTSKESDLITQVTKYLENDRVNIAESAKQDQYLHLNEKSKLKIEELLENKFHSTIKDIEDTLNLLKKNKSELVVLERKLENVPDEELIGKIINKRNLFLSELKSLEYELSKNEEELTDIKKQLFEQQKKLDKLLSVSIENQFEQEKIARILFHSPRVRATLDVFRNKVVKNHIGKIETLVIDCLKKLMRKNNLITAVSIDPHTYSLTLFGNNGKLITQERLSAGERQMLAVSILWALGRASGRPMPIVIDTPLGRLDSTHRIHLVNNYFPFASHQVLLLSTDEEIDSRYYNRLKSNIGRSYTLEYSEKDDSTTISEGYF